MASPLISRRGCGLAVCSGCYRRRAAVAQVDGTLRKQAQPLSHAAGGGSHKLCRSCSPYAHVQQLPKCDALLGLHTLRVSRT